jgi:hypothetical protein
MTGAISIDIVENQIMNWGGKQKGENERLHEWQTQSEC